MWRLPGYHPKILGRRGGVPKELGASGGRQMKGTATRARFRREFFGLDPHHVFVELAREGFVRTHAVTSGQMADDEYLN